MMTQVEYITWLIDHYHPGIELEGRAFHDCRACGAMVSDDRLIYHAEWHEHQKLGSTGVVKNNYESPRHFEDHTPVKSTANNYEWPRHFEVR